MNEDLFGNETTPETSRVTVDLFGGRLLAKLTPWDDGLAGFFRKTGGQWHKPVRGYLMVATRENLALITEHVNTHVASAVNSWIDDGCPSLAVNAPALRRKAADVIPTPDDLAAVAEFMNDCLGCRTEHRPLPYQLIASATAIKAGGRFLFADVMGLGKTVEALTWLAYTGRRALPAIIVCTASGRINWKREAEKWLPLDWKISCIGSGTDRWDADSDVLILTYGLAGPIGRTQKLKKEKPVGAAQAQIEKTAWKTVVVDEAHRIANWEALQTKAVRRLGKRARFFLALSATPIMTSPMDLHGVLRTIAPDMIGNKMDFGEKYCGAEFHQLPPPGREKPDSVIKRWWTYNGLTNVDELRLILAGMMLRRTRDEVRTEMPKLRRIILPIGIDRNIYNQKEDDTALELRGDDAKKPADAMRATMSLWACLGRLKVAPAVEWIADYTSGKGRPLVVFFHHHEVGDMLASEISRQMSGLRVARIDGQVTGGHRDEIIQAFQRGEIEVLLAATKAAGESITLTRACDCLMVERQWTAYSEEQAEGRIDRHGQTEPTSATYLCGSIEGQSTLDDDMEDLVGARRQMAVDVLDPDAVQQAEGWTILACAERILNRRDNRE